MAILNGGFHRERMFLARAGMLLSIWLGVLGFNLVSARAQSPAREYQLKAVFLYNFAQFTEWPTNVFEDANSPVVIGVLGRNPYGNLLEETVKGERINGRQLVVQSYSRVEDIKQCHLLFICPSEAARQRQILASLKGRSILTVGETDNFTQQGGMIRFLVEKNKIRFLINPEAAKQANLTLSSKLLRLAEIFPAERN